MATSVLIVEDDHGLRSALSRDLSRRGYLATFVARAEDALDVLTAAHSLQHDPFHVLLVDLMLEEGWSGLDLLLELPRVSPTTRAILMSGYASAKDHRIARDLGAVAVISKPFEDEDLVAAIDKAAACRGGLYGDLHGFSLVGLLGLFHEEGASLTLSFQGERQGTIVVHQGEVVDARAGDAEGEDAVALLAEEQTAFVRTSLLPTEVRRTIRRPMRELLAVLKP